MATRFAASYRALIFDFFGVICSEIAPFWLHRFFDDVESERIKKTVVHDADLGTISQAEMFAVLGKLVGLSSDEVEEQWWGYVKIDHDVVRYLNDAAKLCALGLLTNSPSPFIRKILSNHSLEPIFDTIVVSSEVKIAKPDPAIYHEILRRLEISPNEALMVDDNPSNINSAKGAGLDGVVYRSRSDLPVLAAS